MKKSDLILLVQRIADADGGQDELDELIEIVSRAVPHPNWSDLLYFPEEDMSPEEVVEAALRYRPIEL